MEDEEFHIVIDTAGDEKEENANNKFITQLLDEYYEEKCREPPTKPLESVPSKIDRFFKDMGWQSPLEEITEQRRPRPKKLDPRKDLLDDKIGVAELLKKSVVLDPDFEKLGRVRPDIKERKLAKIRKREREKTKGKSWYNMPATEVTDELKRDLEVLKMRSVLDPKHFYKKNDLKVLPKYFQVGKVMDSPLEYHDRLTKKERKKTLVDELLADADFNKYNKKKYAEIIKEKQKTHYKAYKAAKKLKRKKNK